MTGHEVEGGVVKIVELVGSSGASFSDAVRNAVRTASKSLRNIQGVDVLGSSATVGGDGELRLYKVHCKVAFLVESASSGDTSSSGASDVGAGTAEPQTTRPTDEPPAGITAETIPSVEDGTQD